MTRAELSRLYYLQKEVEMWEKLLVEIGCKSEIMAPVTYKVGGMAKNKINSAVEDRVIKKSEIVEKLEELKEKTIVERNKILDYVNMISDSLLKQIIVYRCYKLMSWKGVAMFIGGGNSADSVRKKFDRSFPKK